MRKWTQLLLICLALLAGFCVDGYAAHSQKKSDVEPSLFREAERGNLQKVKSLIERGAGVNAKNKEGETPLHCAAEEGCLDVVRFLIENGANVNAKTDHGKTAEAIARKSGNVKISQFLAAVAKK
ncbi:MAG: ankyrin repeat domain-containing protein [Thermoguttaceae bacterium]|nr:ankyrin repeat domain-containing protein [Thermoguttaceae bacterium]